MKYVKHASRISVFIVCLSAAFVFIGYAETGAPEKTNCDADITWEVVQEAKLTQFDCELGKHEGQPALIFTVGLENSTDKPQRYRVNIFLEDMDKGFGHLVPPKGDPPVLEPGKAGTAKIPFIGVDKESKKILVIVKTLGI